LYKRVKTLFERRCLEARTDYYSAKFNSIGNDSRRLWCEINSCIDKKPKRDSCSIHRIIYDNKPYHSKHVAPVLNNHFATIGSKLNNQLPYRDISEIDKYMPRVNTTFSFEQVVSTEV